MRLHFVECYRRNKILSVDHEIIRQIALDALLQLAACLANGNVINNNKPLDQLKLNDKMLIKTTKNQHSEGALYPKKHPQ